LTRKYRHDAVVSSWKISGLEGAQAHKTSNSSVHKKQFIKTVATVDHLYMVDHVKFLTHLRLYGMLQHNHWGPDRLMVLWRKLLDPRPLDGPWSSQDWCPWYTECRNGAQTRQTWFTILCHYLPVTVCGLRDSLSVTDSGSHLETLFEAPFADFCVTKVIHRTFSSDISKKRACSKFWPHIIRGPPFSRGPYARAYRA